MPEITAVAKEWGAWVAIAIFLVYKVATFLIEKYAPAVIARKEKEIDRKASLEDKLFEWQKEIITVIASNTEAVRALTKEFDAHLGSLTRALDSNTLVVSDLLRARREN